MPRVHIVSSLCTIMLAVLSFFAVHVTPTATAEAAFHKTCTDCHTRGKALKTATVTELCLSCHPGNTKDHLLGVMPMDAPSSLPLDNGHKMNCVTCHEPHGQSTTETLLRMKKAELCISCHPAK